MSTLKRAPEFNSNRQISPFKVRVAAARGGGQEMQATSNGPIADASRQFSRPGLATKMEVTLSSGCRENAAILC